MLNLVGLGPKLLAVRANSPEAMVEYLRAHFPCTEMAQLGTGFDANRMPCMLCVVDEQGTPASARYIAVERPIEHVLCHLMEPEAQSLINAVRALPPSIVFNSLGEQKPVVDKIQSEFHCERTNLTDLLHRDSGEGVVVAFLMEEQPGLRKFYDEMLFIRLPIQTLLRYLSIHAPRYLAKAFPPNAWHMVDLRIFDRHEAYGEQYVRLVKAIRALNLGYLVTETWNREFNTFRDPVGTYSVRLLTFLEPLELKKLLIGLEYGQDGVRIVDLDVFWHNKKISWKDLLDDKETRKAVKQTASFFPHSSFFAVQNDKAALVRYCADAVAERLSDEEKNELRQLEQTILEKGLALE